ncbi:hypothetical protein KAU33_04035 [Candidatus Dependentiae bacterium]|nr:hypothetical protein [Candidatus Dependentiae bacterium]
MITWIKGQNTTGKTILVKKLLGATFEQKDFIPLKIMKNPLDIKNDFPEHLIPSDFVFYYDIVMPKHITFTIGSSQIHIFLEKVRGNAKERNKIFRLYEKFLTQNDTIKEKEHRIKELDDEIKSRHDQYREERSQWQTTKKELEGKIAKIDELSTEIDKLLDVPEFKRYHELLDNYMKSKFTEKQPKHVYEALWDKVKRYERLHDQIVDSMWKKEKSLLEEKESIGKWYDLIKKLEKHEKHPPGIPFTHGTSYRLNEWKRNLKKHKNKLITKGDTFELIKNFSSEKKVWIDGKPSSQFEDFYDIIEIVKALSPEELFISHCGNKLWFQQAFVTSYRTERGLLTLDLTSFKKVYIEVPSMDEKVTLTNDKSEKK